ncbi:MAG: zinc ribbon domain-containing protein [Clostridia bacterium]|nr:zinc ribbon domain-containing protein [Clostridia bacterium]
MFKNIGRKIKTLALVLFWIELVTGVLAALGGGMMLIVTEGRHNTMMIVLGVAIVIIGSGLVFLLAWIGSFFMYGLGQLIDDTEINRKTNQQILEKLNSKPVEKAPVVNTPPAEPVVNTPVPPVTSWVCPKCGNVNDLNAQFCTNCGTRKA